MNVVSILLVAISLLLISCKTQKDGSSPNGSVPPPNLAEALAANPTLKTAINMETTTSNFLFGAGTLAETNWDSWSTEDKAALEQAFISQWNWLYNTANNLSNLGTDQFTTPVTCPNCEAGLISSPGSSALTTVSNATGNSVYFAQVAHALALELGGALPWSVASESSGYLHHYFNSRAAMHRYNPTTIIFGRPTFQVDQRIKYLGTYSPATPRYIYAFLKNNNILQSTRTATINALLQWARTNLLHYYNGNTYQNLQDHWQYPSDAPVTRIIDGTVFSGDPGVKHWTQGCHGTAAFIKSVLRAVNIPVEIILTCGHSQLYFPTELKYLDHGDNPYNSNVKNSTLDISNLLIDQATHTAWFGATPDFLAGGHGNCANIGRKTGDF